MCGVMADMQIIFNLVKNLYPKIYDILEEKEENCGDFIGNNLINQGLNNLFTNDILNNETSLLIWDLLFGPMAVTIMAGLTVSTILTLVIIPVLTAIAYNVKSPD